MVRQSATGVNGAPTDAGSPQAGTGGSTQAGAAGSTQAGAAGSTPERAAAVTGLLGPLHRRLPPPPGGLRKGPLREDAWRSPLRSERTAAMLGVWVGIAFAVCFVTGLISHLIQQPPTWFLWPSRPVNLYRVTQGLHVISGFAAIPLLLAKLWTVYPKLFEWPPVRSIAHAVSRVSLLVLVGAALFQLVTGVLNVARWYTVMPFFFTTTHYWTAWIAIGAIAVHVGSKLTVIRLGLSRPVPADAQAPVDGHSTAADTDAAADVVAGVAADRDAAAGPGVDPAADDPAADDPAGTDGPAAADNRGGTADGRIGTADGGHDADTATDRPGDLTAGRLSRRGFLTAVAATSGIVALTTAGQTVPALSAITVFGQRDPSLGPQGLPVNKSARSAGVMDTATDPTYRLILDGPRPQRLSLAALRAMPMHTVTLPITCVEGWSATAQWTGIRMADLLDLVGLPADGEVDVESLQEGGLYRASVLSAPHTRDDLTLLAMRLNGEDLDIDHGYPVRLIAPNRPGVMQTKWVTRITAR